MHATVRGYPLDLMSIAKDDSQNVESRVRDILVVAKHLKLSAYPDSQVALLTVAGYVVHARKLLVQALKVGEMDGRAVTRLREELDQLVRKNVVSPPSPSIVRKVHVSSQPVTRPAAPPITAIDEEQISNEMIEMTSGMREMANTVRSVIRKDLAVLSATADSQQQSLDGTQVQNASAKAIRSSKRLSFMMTVFMIISSVVIFLALIPIMVVT